jgi:hypothetical protein
VLAGREADRGAAGRKLGSALDVVPAQSRAGGHSGPGRIQALQNPSGSGRIAAAWYSGTSFTVDMDLTDSQAHNLELYLLDYDSPHVASRSSSPMPTLMPS